LRDVLARGGEKRLLLGRVDHPDFAVHGTPRAVRDLCQLRWARLFRAALWFCAKRQSHDYAAQNMDLPQRYAPDMAGRRQSDQANLRAEAREPPLLPGEPASRQRNPAVRRWYSRLYRLRRCTIQLVRQLRSQLGLDVSVQRPAAAGWTG